MARRALIVMAKDPRPGLAKTRLIPAIGASAAAGLYRAFLQDVLDTSALVPADRFVYGYPPDSLERLAAWSDGRFRVRPQKGATLSERMIAAFSDCFAAGYGAVAMRNSDSPSLPASALHAAFAALESGADLVLGPDRGGGYYLVGLKAPRPELFRGFAMSTASVLEETLRRAAAAGMKSHRLETWLDIDTGDDLAALVEELRSEAICPRTRAFLATLPSWSDGRGKNVPAMPRSAAEDRAQPNGGAALP